MRFIPTLDSLAPGTLEKWETLAQFSQLPKIVTTFSVKYFWDPYIESGLSSVSLYYWFTQNCKLGCCLLASLSPLPAILQGQYFKPLCLSLFCLIVDYPRWSDCPLSQMQGLRRGMHFYGCCSVLLFQWTLLSATRHGLSYKSYYINGYNSPKVLEVQSFSLFCRGGKLSQWGKAGNLAHSRAQHVCAEWRNGWLSALVINKSLWPD